jgi:hypothetical protein
MILKSDDTQVFKAFCMAMENSIAAGIETGPVRRDDNFYPVVKELNSTLLPNGIMSVGTIQGQAIKRPLKVLFISGSIVTSQSSYSPMQGDGSPGTHETIIHLLTVSGWDGGVETREHFTNLVFPVLSPTRSYVNALARKKAVICTMMSSSA